MISINETIAADKIPGRLTLLDEGEDLLWALEVHCGGKAGRHYLDHLSGVTRYTAIILSGHHESSPDAVYATKTKKPLYNSKFIRLA